MYLSLIILKKEARPSKHKEFIDHAYFSAIVLFKELFATLGNEGTRNPIKREHLDALTAIALHNSLYKRKLSRDNGLKLDDHAFMIDWHPLAYLLQLTDELQCWDRMSYGRNTRSELHPMACNLSFDDKGIYAEYVFDKAENNKITDYLAKYEKYKENAASMNKPKLKSFSKIQNDSFAKEIGLIVGLSNYGKCKGSIKLEVTQKVEDAEWHNKHIYLSTSNFVHIYEFAAALNAQYNKTYIPGKTMLDDFDMLSLEYKLSNIGQAKYFAEALDEIGCFYTDRPVAYEMVTSFSDIELKRLGAFEHKRWENEKQSIVEQLRTLLSEGDVTAIKEQVAELKNHFYRIVHQEQENLRKAAEEAGEAYEAVADETEQAFRQLLNDYKARRDQLLQKQNAELEQNLLRKENIIAQMKNLANPETADVMGDLQKMRDLQAEWKTIGPVPAPKVQELWREYNRYQEQFYDLVKINIELRDLDFKRNLEAKTALCERAEALDANTNIVEANRILQQLHNEWAEIGPVARDQREALWERFKAASAVVNKKHQAYFDAIHQREEENLKNKQALIEQLKSIDLAKLKSNKAWDEAGERIQAIQQQWRTIGYAPKKFNQAVYDEYRALCEQFYKAKAAYYKTTRDMFSENLKLKRELLAKAEELKSSQEWQETTQAFINLQEQWKKIGPVARKYSDDIWKQFTAACDSFFEAKREAGKQEREAFRQRREKASEKWHKNLDNLTDRNRLIRMYEALQAEIRTAENNIMFFTSKSGNALVNSLQKKIDDLKKQAEDIENKINELDHE